MITVSIHQLLNAVQPRPRDNGQARSPLDVLLLMTTSADAAWQIRAAADAIRAAIARYDEIRLSLAAHYGQPDENGNYTFETDEKQAAFLARFEELLNHQIDLPVELLTRPQLAEMKLSASDLDALFFLVESSPADDVDFLSDFALPELQISVDDESE